MAVHGEAPPMPIELPPVGLGTSALGIRFGDAEDDPAECVSAVSTALELGYRHIDTAQMYGN